MSNQLIHEKSPYLLQHANNPVDWHPWGEAAFEKARKEDKPIFLSIGYSTCHWCHVMERESFENEQIAEVLNRYFVPVKVDREERPDVDRIYMTFVQATSGSGGWPMSVFLTPELRPFFGGTYFPPDNRYGRPGFQMILQSLAKSWKDDRARINESGANVVRQLAQYAEAKPGRAGGLDASILDLGFSYFRRTFDSVHGGFGDAPKFPRPSVLNFLLRYYARTKQEEPLDMTLKTLREMAGGGMNDQLGGGFHRYSVDERWFVPHFEKMLYDQAQLVVSYLEAFQITHEPFYAHIARNTLDYVLRDMTSPEGGFYSAEDADSVIDRAHPHEKGEGAFYVWTRQEIDAVLGHPDASSFSSRYGVETAGNVHNDPHGEFPGKNILYVARESTESFDQAKAKLLEVRNRRIRPHLDDKILTAWNGLMISAFAKAAQVLDEPRYEKAARGAADFVLTRLYNSADRTLLRRYRDSDASIAGFLDDYAFFVQGLLDLYATTFDLEFLKKAVAMTDTMLERFEDHTEGAFFSTSGDDPSLVLRLKDDYDGAEPSGNSIAAMNLVRLASLLNSDQYRQAAERTLNALSSRLTQQTPAVPQLLAALDAWLAPKRQVILATPARESAAPFLSELRRRFQPGTTVILLSSEQDCEFFGSTNPVIESMKPVNGKPTAYVCENYACQLPVTDLDNFSRLLQ